jgi:lipoprotein signal peptidase
MVSRTFQGRDLVAGTIIALLMGIFFTLVGGKPLVVTFVPGLVVSWLIFVGMYHEQRPLPVGSMFFPIYFATLAWQFLHFTEEYLTGFYVDFPRLYGASPFSPGLFVSFNMASYFVFVVACLLVWTKDLRFLVIPALFFIVYGAIGNAISHTWWAILQKAAFPGFFTAQAYWIIGPLALSRLIGSRRDALIAVVVFAAVLIPILTVFVAA